MAVSRGKVLVLDDDPLALRIIRARLEGAGYEVATREEALGTSQAIIDEDPDLLLLDLKMPALDGEALTELVKREERTRDVPIVFHSSEDLVRLQARARKCGVLGAIAKTGDDAMFLAQFERLFARIRRSPP